MTEGSLVGGLPSSASDERMAIVGTSGSGKTYAAKGMVEQLLDAGARVCVVDPLGVWWGLRASADGTAAGYPVVVFGGQHADVRLDEGMGAALGRLVGAQSLACVVDLSELGSSAARRRFMSGFSGALYEANTEPLHLVLDEADLWAPQRPLPEAQTLLGRVEEIVRRGRVRGFIPWLITQRPAVVHKDVLSQADILIAMKLTSSQDRDAIGGWIEGQADRAEGKRILAELPRLARGEGVIWAPSDGMLKRVAFPAIRTFDSSRTPRRGERAATPRTLAEVDLSAITAALAETVGAEKERPSRDRDVQNLQRQLDAAVARAGAAERRLDALLGHLRRIADEAGSKDPAATPPAAARLTATALPRAADGATASTISTPATPPTVVHPAGRKLLAALARHSPARFTWGQAATLAGLTPSGGHFNAGRKELRDRGMVDELANGLVAASSAGLAAAGELPPAPATAAERLEMWCSRLPSPAPEMLRKLAEWGERFNSVEVLAVAIGKKPTGGHWNSGLALLRNNGLIEVEGKRLRANELLR